MAQDPNQAQDVDFNELNKEEILAHYQRVSEERGIEMHAAFIQYLERSYDDNLSLDIIIEGNGKYMFNDRITDQHL